MYFKVVFIGHPNDVGGNELNVTVFLDIRFHAIIDKIKYNFYYFLTKLRKKVLVSLHLGLTHIGHRRGSCFEHVSPESICAFTRSAIA